MTNIINDDKGAITLINTEPLLFLVYWVFCCSS